MHCFLTSGNGVSVYLIDNRTPKINATYIHKDVTPIRDVMIPIIRSLVDDSNLDVVGRRVAEYFVSE